MKGIIFNMLEQFIIETTDIDTYEEILDECQFSTAEPFIGPGTYPDADLMQIVGKTVEKLQIPLPDVLHAFGKWGFAKLAVKVPEWLTQFDHPKPFLMTVENIVHLEVRKLYQDAQPPHFTFEDPAPDQLIIHYVSGRHLYDLMDGLIDGVGEYFSVPIRFERNITRAKDGCERCTYHLTFALGE